MQWRAWSWSFPGFVDTLQLKLEGVTCPEQGSHPAAFREQIVELHRAGRSADDLAREFEPCVAMIHGWIRQADRDGGRRADILSSEERNGLRRLRRENKQLRQERNILSKGEPANAWFGQNDLTGPTSSRHDVNQAEFPIGIMARSMGISRSGFYAWQVREPCARNVADRALTELIHQIHAASRESYGAPRIYADLAPSRDIASRCPAGRWTR